MFEESIGLLLRHTDVPVQWCTGMCRFCGAAGISFSRRCGRRWGHICGVWRWEQVQLGKASAVLGRVGGNGGGRSSESLRLRCEAGRHGKPLLRRGSGRSDLDITGMVSLVLEAPGASIWIFALLVPGLSWSVFTVTMKVCWR